MVADQLPIFLKEVFDKYKIYFDKDKFLQLEKEVRQRVAEKYNEAEFEDSDYENDYDYIIDAQHYSRDLVLQEIPPGSYQRMLLDCHEAGNQANETLQGLINLERSIIIQLFKEKYHIEINDIILAHQYGKEIEVFVEKFYTRQTRINKDSYAYRYSKGFDISEVFIAGYTKLKSGKKGKRLIDWINPEEIIEVYSPDGRMKFKVD
jgi:hypothetical protein